MAEVVHRSSEMVADPDQGMETTINGVKISRRGQNAVVDFNPGMDRTSMEDSDEHQANIADELSEHEQVLIVATMLEQFKADLESRSSWQNRNDQAMELLGLRNEPLDDLPFEGASAVTYPLIGEACVQFQARAIEEVFPSGGPCKTRIVGEKTDEKVEQAERVAQHMNYQMMDQDKAYFWHVDQMLFWLPLAGSCFKKTYYDPISDMVVSRLVHAGDFIVPYMCTDLRTASRYTHRMYRPEEDMKRLMASEFYRTVELEKPANAEIDSDDMLDSSREMVDEADDRQPSFHDDDFIYEVLEMHCDLELEMDQKTYLDDKDVVDIGLPMPYIVTVDKTSEQLLSIRRNWHEDDELFTKRMWFTHYKYLPGLGFYGFGLLHLIGSIAEASTGTLRALLDAAAYANLQGGFMSDEARINPEDATITPGTWKQVKMSAEELQKAFYTPPFKEPSAALSQLFGILVDTGRRFASITEENVGDAPNTGPVGTTLALIEQAGKVFSGIHRRLHVAQAEEFELRAELNFDFLDDEYPYQIENKDVVIAKADYDGAVDVIPISDPNIFSNTQRIAQIQTVLEVAKEFPGEVDVPKAIDRLFRALKIPDHEELLQGKSEQHRMDPIAENMRMLTMGGAKAYVEQDHEAHIAVHMNFLQGLNEDALNVMGMVMQAHLAEHYAYKYFNEMNALANGQLPPPTFMDGEMTEEDELDPEMEAMIAQFAAQAPPIQIMPPDEEGPDEEQKAFDAEESRKEQSFHNEEARKEAEFDGDQRRTNRSGELDNQRKNTSSTNEESRKETSAAEERQRKRRDEREARLEKDRGE